MSSAVATRTPEQTVAEDWFPTHVIAEHTHLDKNTEVMRWARPEGGSIYAVEYIRRRGTLFVQGDLGEATYCWYPDVSSLERIAQFDFSYFHSKCQASEYGKNFRKWDRDKAHRDLADAIESHAEGYAECEEQQKELESKLRQKAMRLGYSPGCEAFYEQWSATHWIAENGYELFGGEWYEYFNHFGMEASLRCYGHWMGLRMAFGHWNPEAGS
jgi:hypothetical protein